MAAVTTSQHLLVVEQGDGCFFKRWRPHTLKNRRDLTIYGNQWILRHSDAICLKYGGIETLERCCMHIPAHIDEVGWMTN